jgi:lipopolysaccharide/colanic/teichoic acid biosynthesis glycosyltransferase
MYEKYFKRLIDIIISFSGLLVFSPLFLIVYLLNNKNLGSLFFCQKRIGKGGKVFKIIKFRTMIENKDEELLQFTPGSTRRVTRIGKLLRKSKIDELPTLINVLKGDMSIVGPRPEVPKYLYFYCNEYKEVLRVRPGVTDFASIKYRNEEEILSTTHLPQKMYETKILPDKLKLNLAYVKEISLWRDILIILKTIKAILHN